MPRTQPLLPLLRPLAAPSRAPPCGQLFRFSTATRLRVNRPSTPREAARAADLAAAEAATDVDSPNAPAPKPTLPSTRPAPSTPTATVVADNVQPPVGDALDAAMNLSTTKPKTFKGPQKARTSSKANPTAADKPTLELAPPRYHVARSSTKNLPIYTDYKRGGNLHLTTIRKITGDLSALRDELRVFLNKKNEDVKINSLTQHVIIKGHHVPEVTEFLRARGM